MNHFLAIHPRCGVSVQVCTACFLRRIEATESRFGARHPSQKAVGLYNHGGWFGEPENQVAIINELKLSNIGIIYNFHHGQAHVGRFAEMFKLITGLEKLCADHPELVEKK